MSGTTIRLSSSGGNTVSPFNHTRKAIAKDLRKAVKEINRLLALALNAGVMVSLEVDGRPRYDVATYREGVEKMAKMEWALCLRAFVAKKRHPKDD